MERDSIKESTSLIERTFSLSLHFDDLSILDWVHLWGETWGKIPIPVQGKKVVVSGWQKITSFDASLFHDFGLPYNNYALVCGEIGGICVLDVDAHDQGVEFWLEWSKMYEPLDTLTVLTGGGGYHYYFQYTEALQELRNGVQVIPGIGIDVKNHCGCVVGPGSVHPETREKYRIVHGWEEDSEPKFSEMPSWLLNVLLVWKQSKRFSSIRPEFWDLLRTFISYIHEGKLREKAENKIQQIESENFSESSSMDISLKTSSSDEVSRAESLLSLLHPSRADLYQNWLQVGMTLVELGEEGFTLWDRWSQQSEKYDAKIIREKWNSFQNYSGKRLTLRSLHRWAKEDNSEEYRIKFFSSFSEDQIDLSQDEDEGSIACWSEYRADDPYKIYSLICDIKEQEQVVFETKALAFEWFQKRASRCIRVVYGAEKTVLVKENKDYPFVQTIATPYTFPSGTYGKESIFYRGKPTSKCPEGKILSLYLYEILRSVKFGVDRVHCTPYHEDIGDQTSEKFQDSFNTFRGYGAHKVKEISEYLIRPILQHIFVCWANQNAEVYKYLVYWLSFGLQFPLEKPDVMVVLLGSGGEGKSILIDFIINQVYGSLNCRRFDGLDEIVKWPGVMNDKLFICIEELISMESTGAKYFRPFETMKTFITGETIEGKNKNIRSFERKNYLRFIGTTNNERAIPIRDDGIKRRFFLQHVSNIYKGNWDYFETLSKSLNQEVGDHFFTYLLDLKDTIKRKILEKPDTEWFLESVENSKSPEILFMEEVLNGLIDFSDQEIEIQEDLWLVHTKVLYEKYRSWCVINGYRTKEVRFFVSQSLKKSGAMKVGDSQGRIVIQGKRDCGWGFPITSLPRIVPRIFSLS